MKHYAVLGHPIKHSRSPAIHQSFARQFGHDISYERLHAAPGSFADVVHAFRAGGGAGLNVTLPYKLEAYALCQKLGPSALAAGAVNTLVFDGEHCFGENTDGAGLVDDVIGRLGFVSKHASVMVFGAGGASRGILKPLFESGCQQVTLVNRDVQKARQVCEAFQALWKSMTPSAFIEAKLDWASYEELIERSQTQSWDLLINATSAGLHAQPLNIPPSIFASSKLAYDMVYASVPTDFMQQALQGGCPRASDGLGMLVGQAAHAYALWHGVMPKVEPVYRDMRALIDAA